MTAYTNQLAGLASDPLRQWLDIIRKKQDDAIANDTSFADFQAQLLDSYGDLPSDELVKVMELAFSTADLAGRNDVQQGQ